MIAKRWKRKGLAGVIFVAVLLLSGCDNTTTTVSGWDRSGGVVTIVDDSLALVNYARGEDTCEENEWSGLEDCESSFLSSGLFLVNYRNKQTPLWGDTLDYYLSFYGNYFSDSSVMTLDASGRKFGFWRIGGVPSGLKSWTWTGTCSPKLQGTKRARPWKDGDVLILGEWIPQGGDSCQYAVLDTSTGIVSQGRFSDDDSWLAKCDDINYFNGKVACLRKDTSFACAVDLIVDDVSADTLVMDSCGFVEDHPSQWMGNFVRFDIFTADAASPAYLNQADRLYKVDVSSMTFDRIYPELWLNGVYKFIQEDGSMVQYYPEDLAGTGGEE